MNSTLPALLFMAVGALAHAQTFKTTGRDFSRLLGPMMEELHQQYVLGFSPPLADGRLHSLVVTTRRSDVKIRTRKHYVAPAR